MRGGTSGRAAREGQENGQKRKTSGKRPGMPGSYLKHLNNPDGYPWVECSGVTYGFACNLPVRVRRYALVWGASAKHRPQRVGKEHVLQDEDIVQIVKRI
jgi:hypothetical protein